MIETPDSQDAARDKLARLTLGFAPRSWRNAGREGLWVIAGQVMTAIAGLAGLRILTELASRELIGQASMLLGVFAIARNVFLSPVANAQLRFHPEHVASGQAAWFTRRMSRFTWLGALGLVVALGLATGIWKGIDRSVPFVAILALAAAVSAIDAAKSIRVNRLSAERKRAASALWTSLEAWLTVLCSAAALKWSESRESYLAGQTVGMLIALGLFGFVFFPSMPRDSQPHPVEGDRRLRDLIVRFGLPFVPLAIVGWISGLGDRYIVGGWLGSAEVGTYTAAYGLASRPFLMVGGVMATFARPILFEAEGQGNARKANRVFVLWLAITAGISAMGVVAFWLLGDRLAAVFLAVPFRHRDTTAIFVWVGMAYAFMNGIQVLENRLLSLGISSRLVMPAVAGALASILLNLLLIPRFGIAGAAKAAAATFLIQGLLVALSCLGARRRAVVPAA